MVRGGLVGVVAVFLTACGGPGEPTAADDTPEPAGFAYDAARLCTATANDHLDDAPEDPGPEVLVAARKDETPSSTQIAEWAQAYAELVGRHEAMRAELAALDGGTEQEQLWWTEIVESGDADLAISRPRRDVLETGDWSRIDAEFSPRSGSADPLAALAGLRLEKSDCVAPYAQFGLDVPAVSRDFVRAAATTCTRIVNRRLAADFSADVDTGLSVLADIVAGRWSGEVGPDVEPALADLIAEWTTTRDDLGGVDADSAPDPSDWADVLAAADERIEIYQARRDAVLGGDRSAIEAVFRPDYEFPGADFTTNGLVERSCRGVSF